MIMKKLLVLVLVAFVTVQASAGNGDTEPKVKDAKKDSAAAKKDINSKGFRDLFSSDGYNPAKPYALQINPKAVPYIDDYIDKHKAQLESMKIWGKPYFRMMEHILSSYGLPSELKYLAVIESNLQNSAVSWVGARGPWQFMPETARQLGLVVNQYRDDRTDYYKSTHAAAQYLKILYDQVGGDWLLVIAAYNGGPGRVFSAIKRTGTRDFWGLQYSLPTESRNHVKKFIATHYVMEGTGGVTTVTSKELSLLHEKAIEENNNAISSGFGDNNSLRAKLPAQQIEGTTTQKIQGKYNSMILANSLGYDIAQFNKLNPGFDKLVSEEEGYELRLPDEKMQQFSNQRYQILQQSIMASLQSVTDTPEGFPEPKKQSTPVVKKKK
jgi:membrane-bound lytic murein transglycosylase D